MQMLLRYSFHHKLGAWPLYVCWGLLDCIYGSREYVTFSGAYRTFPEVFLVVINSDLHDEARKNSKLIITQSNGPFY